MTATTRVCPKCGQEMYKLERNGVVIDRCSHCGGVFLDRGALQALLRAESEHQAGGDDLFEPVDDEEDPSRKRSSRRGFLEELFDFG